MRRVWYCDAEGNAWEALGVAGRCPRCRSRDVFYYFFMVVVVIRYKTKATARRALTFIVLAVSRL